MLRNDYHVSMFNNGNINMKCGPLDFEELKDNKWVDEMDIIREKLFNIDTYFTGEETYYYRGAAWILYSYASNKEYELFETDINCLKRGLTIKLRGRKPTEETMARMA